MGEQVQPSSVLDLIGESHKERISQILKDIPVVDKVVASLAMKGFIPFETDPPKQKRYKEFLERKMDPDKHSNFLDNATLEQILEEREFSKAALIFRPMSAMMASRFVSSTTPIEENKSIPIGLHHIDSKVITASK